MELVRVPAGEFLMGSDPAKDSLADGDEKPQHPVTLTEFYIGKHEVTNAQYAAFVKATGATPPSDWENGNIPAGKEDHPVVYVSWADAEAFTQWLSEQTGMGFRLCSEAEWEKVCRGESGAIYPWGDAFDANKANTSESGIGTTTPVGKYSPGGDSPYGVADLAGNGWEWTSSAFKEYPYDPADGREDTTSTDVRVLRGGSFFDDAGSARCANRDYVDADYRLDLIGLRVCVAPGL
jgi:formylglycine-generating enzyme required for sulfatase activity